MSLLHRNVARYSVPYGVSKRITATWLRDVRLSMVGCTLSPLLGPPMDETDATLLIPTSRSANSATSLSTGPLRTFLVRGTINFCFDFRVVISFINFVRVYFGVFSIFFHWPWRRSLKFLTRVIAWQSLCAFSYPSFHSNFKA